MRRDSRTEGHVRKNRVTKHREPTFKDIAVTRNKEVVSRDFNNHLIPIQTYIRD